MSLTDNEILELTTLCNSLIDGTITDAQKVDLTARLTVSEPAREFHVRFMAQSASLYYYASEMITEAPDHVASINPKNGNRFRWVVSMLALAASIAVVLWITHRSLLKPTTTVARTINEEEYVGRLTGSKECQWVQAGSAVAPGSRLKKGQRLNIARGFVEITFDSGALVILQGPVSLDLNSAWNATLNRGTLRANVPPEAQGFTISNPHVDVLDLGTEFTMYADEAGTSAEVLVLKGQVETTPRVPVDQEKIVLAENEARRFDTTGSSVVESSDQNFGELTQPVALDRYEKAVSFAHWSLDDAGGTQLKVNASDFLASDLQIQGNPKVSKSSSHADGQWSGALHFDGVRYATAAAPDISENSPHTVSYWVKIPSDAVLSTAYAMIAWGADSQKFGTHPFHIGWNRNPSEGLVGALRTDYGRGFAVGQRPLRDGRWHHIAVVFIPRDDADSPMEVKQYVDGHLDGEGRSSPSGSDIFYSTKNKGNTTSGSIWLGCRLGTKGVRNDRFYGDMDELFIANAALEPQEIVRLMNNNRLSD